MRIHPAFLALVALSATLGFVAAQDRPVREPSPTLPGKAQATAAPEREPDIRAITDLSDSFVKAYNGRDAKALGELFTAEAEIEDEDGAVTRGREAIIGRFSALFKENGQDKLAVNTESVRFLGQEIAVEQGTASLSAGTGTPGRPSRYQVIYSRQGGRWLHARIRDQQPDDVSAHDQLRQLEWMLGDWINESDDGNVLTTCKWSDDGNFLLREFDVKIEGRIALKGTQRIAWDAQRKQFRMWVFDDGGGFAEGFMSRDGDRWVVNGSGVRSDGRSVSFTNMIKVLGKDRLLWSIVDRTIAGEAVPEFDQFQLVRRAPAPAK